MEKNIQASRFLIDFYHQRAVVTHAKKQSAAGKITLHVTSALGWQAERGLLTPHGFVAVDLYDRPMEPLGVLPTIWFLQTDIATARRIVNLLASEPVNIHIS